MPAPNSMSPPASPIVLIPLFRGLQMTTTGVALAKSTLDLEVPQFAGLLPRALGLFVIGLTENVASADLEWNIGFISGWDRQHEASAIDIATATFDSGTTSGVRSAEYTTTTNFLTSGRLQVWWRNKAGVAGAKSGLASAILGVHLYS